MDKDKIQEVLTSLGYTLSDKGSYWQTSAIFRGGDNKTAIQIYKDTGIWKDYVQQTPYMPFEKLLKITLKTNDDSLIKNYIKTDCDFDFERRTSEKKIEMEKTYPESSLSRLLPHYKFYNDRGISTDTLKLFKGGLATEGKMFQRFVFPIFNSDNKIHGFSGRIMSKSSTAPKWKHVGVKSKWIYPHNLSLNEIQKKQEVILVESIGDVLSLFENGYKNILCTFGLEISPSLISYLVGVNPKKIIISFNNDKLSKNNAGKNGAIKNFLKLQKFLDNQKIYIHLPTKNDFGEMNSEDFTEWSNKLLKVEKQEHDLNIINDVNKILRSEQGKSSPKSYINNFKKFKKIYE